jgi:DNA-binding transcriptional ArsR family regulator
METQQDHVIRLLEALASPVRLNIYRLLVEHEPDGLVAGDIAARLDIPGNGISFHLKTLQYTGLVSGHREGRYQRYRACLLAVEGLIAYLTDNCCGHRPELCAPSAAPGDEFSFSCRQSRAK